MEKGICVWVPVFARLMDDNTIGSVSSPDFDRVNLAVQAGLVIFETKPGYCPSDDDCDRADAAITDLMIPEIQR